MRTTLIAVFFLITSALYAQTAVEILQKAYDKCQSVQNGHYLMVERLKSMERSDTLAWMLDCHFLKIENDTLCPALFHYTYFNQGKPQSRTLYTGDALVKMSEKDSSAVIATTAEWSPYIRSTGDHRLYSPITKLKSSPLRVAINYPESTAELIGEDTLKGKPCHHVRVTHYPAYDPDDILHTLLEEYEYWINTSNDIPEQYSIASQVVYGKDTMYQYLKRTLKNYEFNTPQDNSVFTMASIPAYYYLKNYVPPPELRLLTTGSSAPDWTLPTLTGDRISLQAQRGNVVLLDFFYKSCYPCVLAIPGLQSLHEKYSDQGLRVIGIDPFDKPGDNLVEFVTKLGVTYPVVLDTRDVATTYLASGYPTMYIIDRNGKIIYARSGYGFHLDAELEKIVRQELLLTPIEKLNDAQKKQE